MNAQLQICNDLEPTLEADTHFLQSNAGCGKYSRDNLLVSAFQRENVQVVDER
jgi:hypothetical protein